MLKIVLIFLCLSSFLFAHTIKIGSYEDKYHHLIAKKISDEFNKISLNTTSSFKVELVVNSDGYLTYFVKKNMKYNKQFIVFLKHLQTLKYPKYKGGDFTTMDVVLQNNKK